MCLRGFEVKEGILCASSAGTDSGIELLPPTREPITQERHQVAAALKRKEEKRAHRGYLPGRLKHLFFLHQGFVHLNRKAAHNGFEKSWAMPAIASWRGVGVGTEPGPGKPREAQGGPERPNEAQEKGEEDVSAPEILRRG